MNETIHNREKPAQVLWCIWYLICVLDLQFLLWEWSQCWLLCWKRDLARTVLGESKDNSSAFLKVLFKHLVPLAHQKMETMLLRFKYQFSTACGKKTPYGACLLLPTETKGLPKPMQPACWNINRKTARQGHTRWVRAQHIFWSSALCGAPQDGWHSACLHPEMQMAA